MKTRKSKYEPLFQEMKKGLSLVFKKNILSAQIKRVLQKNACDESKRNPDFFGEWEIEQFIDQNKRAGLRRLVAKRLHKIKYDKIHGKISPAKLYTFEKEVDGLDCACGLNSNKQYFSNLSAIYLLELTDQKITTHYVCKENHDALGRDFKYDEDLAKITFRKKARSSSSYVQYKKTRIYFLEKQNLGMMGVIDFPFKKKDKDLFHIKCTNLERTFLDSVITPQYSGGNDSIVSFFRSADLDLTFLKKIYQKLNPAYPYWQKIGFLLDVMDQKEKSRKWYEFFKGTTLKKFFVDKGYRSDWDFNKKWKIYYPKTMV